MEASTEPIAFLTSRLPSHPRPSRHQRLLLRVLQLATICAHIAYQPSRASSSQRLKATTNASAKFRFRDPLIRRQETFTGRVLGERGTRVCSSVMEPQNPSVLGGPFNYSSQGTERARAS
jgi:hypothetical protein